MPTVKSAATLITKTFRLGNKILTAGNGGSDADAMHFAEELVGKFEKNRQSLPAVFSSVDATILTCIANDHGYDNVFSRQIEGLGTYGDLLFVFNSSGKSKNVICALESTKKGLKSIASLGWDGGTTRSIADLSIIVPCETTARIQEIHTLVFHAWLQEIKG